MYGKTLTSRQMPDSWLISNNFLALDSSLPEVPRPMTELDEFSIRKLFRAHSSRYASQCQVQCHSRICQRKSVNRKTTQNPSNSPSPSNIEWKLKELIFCLFECRRIVSNWLMISVLLPVSARRRIPLTHRLHGKSGLRGTLPLDPFNLASHSSLQTIQSLISPRPAFAHTCASFASQCVCFNIEHSTSTPNGSTVCWHW